MFDWDSDQHENPERSAADVSGQPGTKSGYWRVMASRWLAPVAVVLGIALAAQSVFRINLPFDGTRYTKASVGGLRAALVRGSESEMPDDLIVYDAEQYQNFMTGIVRFNDTDLLQYAATTARDLQQIETVMAPYMLDALSLIHREIERRGLSRPIASARMDTQREAFRARQTAL